MCIRDSYNGLVKEVGGSNTPGVGFALGMERAFAAMAAQGITLPTEEKFDLYFAPLNEEADHLCFMWLTALRSQGIACEKDYMNRSLKAQMKYADKIHAPYVVIVGDSELADQKAVLRCMANAQQKEIDFVNLIDSLVEMVNGGKENE